MTGDRLRDQRHPAFARSPAPAGDPATVTLWQHAATLAAWPDSRSPVVTRDHLIAVRVMKLAEETGEAVAAYIGMTAWNPRKGICATRDDLTAELCDVIITALVALATVTGTPAGAQARLQHCLTARSRRLLDRISASPGPGQWDCARCGDAWYGTRPGDRTCPGGCTTAPDCPLTYQAVTAHEAEGGSGCPVCGGWACDHPHDGNAFPTLTPRPPAARRSTAP